MTNLNEKDIEVNEDFRKESISLEDLKKELTSDQFQMIENVLSHAYKDTEILNSWVMSCIELLNDDQAEMVYLPNNLRVEKTNDSLVFKFKHKFNFLLLIIFIAAFAIAAMGATYWSLYYLNKISLNKDIDGDGVADINIDTTGNNRANINVDINRDNKPDLNIDYKGNRRAVFNIDKNNDKKPDFNLVNRAKDGKKCTINCDLNDDGWPDINIDLNGDGVADVDIDTDGDNLPDFNLDTDGDGKCDLMCDTNKDGICDIYCVRRETEIRKSGPTTVSGEPNVTFTTGELIVTYTSGKTQVEQLLPNDMEEATPIPNKTFTIENTSDYPLNYKLIWKITKNDFETSNLKYSLASDNGGAAVPTTTMPAADTEIARHVTIPAHSTQNYTIAFEFVGINEEQNIDQNRDFEGYITAEYDD